VVPNCLWFGGAGNRLHWGGDLGALSL
jgi:hypothetical protein